MWNLCFFLFFFLSFLQHFAAARLNRSRANIWNLASAPTFWRLCSFSQHHGHQGFFPIFPLLFNGWILRPGIVHGAFFKHIPGLCRWVLSGDKRPSKSADNGSMHQTQYVRSGVRAAVMGKAFYPHLKELLCLCFFSPQLHPWC